VAQLKKTEPAGSELDLQLDALRKDIASLSDSVKRIAGEKAAAVSNAAAGEAEALLKQSRDLGESAVAEVRKKVDTIEGYIVEKPVQSAIIALLVGLFVGSLARR
jgi:ElaB/YqjD/DUF883 family membrane-anchored ribosome-binding protein